MGLVHDQTSELASAAVALDQARACERKALTDLAAARLQMQAAHNRLRVAVGVVNQTIEQLTSLANVEDMKAASALGESDGTRGIRLPPLEVEYGITEGNG